MAQTSARRPSTQIDRERLIALMLGRSFSDMYPAVVATGTADQGLRSGTSTFRGMSRLFAVCSAWTHHLYCWPSRRWSGRGNAGDSRASPWRDWHRHARWLVRCHLDRSVNGLRRNMTFISEDRATEGIFDRNVLENLVASRVPRPRPLRTSISWLSLRRFANKLCAEVTIDAHAPRGAGFRPQRWQPAEVAFCARDGRPATPA